MKVCIKDNCEGESLCNTCHKIQHGIVMEMND
jgi:hypothetical protein